ncbi:Beta-lactamase [Arcticibacter svalbardensis MN12-7]|uniref:Beta-lactamase n=1 Tax=Arcticibacter svalbardensis MN12-7 TaxID=1150600 RepID=R9GXR3_9SPHI|nr:serine hydrolase [Arcticibacter svalbardensis]EOR96463.1 Beta-lactamase [Arcticibacter svalbardensis MN12-7]
MKVIRFVVLVHFVFILFLNPLRIQAQTNGGLPPGLDEYINKVLQTFEVPGMSVSIVKDGKVVLAKGYGVKQLGKTDKVDANTLFSIASNSKAFTATALALLVEEGKLQWDDPVIKYLPWFQMADSYVSTHLTVRDLLVHQSGLAAYSGDLMLFPPSTFNRREILNKLKKLPLANDFRTTYAYDNILYLAAGEIIAAVSGISWEDFIKARIFDPVGMPGSISRYSLFAGMPNIAVAHDRINGMVQVVDHYTELNIGDASDPAGGILSNANDFSNWMITQLDSGRTPSKVVLFKPETTKELWKLVRPIPVSEMPEGLKPAQMDFFGYALGFRTYNYQRYKVVGHGGKLNGFVSQIAMVPDLQLGIAVFTNQESTGAYWSVIYHVLDFYMKNKKHDWLTNYKSAQDSSFAKTKFQLSKNTVQPDSINKIPVALSKFSGNYRDEIYGEVVISNTENGMVMEFKQLPHLTADLSYFQFNTFLATFRNVHLKADAYVTYALNPDGTIDQLKLKIINPESDLEFDDVLLKPVAK